MLCANAAIDYVPYGVFERSGTGSHQENASKQKTKASALIQSEPIAARRIA
jgi:hypothetical protein